MIKRACFVLIFMSLFFLISAAENESMILTPGTENIEVAKFNGKILKEFDVFGYPAAVRDRKKLSEAERKKLIEDYIMKLILQIESDVPEVINSEDYKKAYGSLVQKNAAEFMREEMIREKFFNKKALDGHYKKDPDKFKADGKRSDELIIKDLKIVKEKEIQKFIKDYLKKLVRDKKVEYNDKLFDEISKIKFKDQADFLEKIKSKNLNAELVKYKDKTVYLRHLYDQIQQVKPYHLKNLSDPEILKSLIDGSILNSLLTEKANEKWLEQNPEVIRMTKEQMKYFSGEKYLEILTAESRFIPTKDEMIDYYIAHKDDDELKSKRKMWVFEIFKEYNNADSIKENDKIQVAIELENIRQKTLTGEEFEKYAKFYPRPYSKDGELGFIFETDNAMVGKTAAKMNAGDISDLIIQEKAISIIKVTKVQEPMLYKFEYVEDIIKRNLIEIKRSEFLNNYKNDMLKKYGTEIFKTEQQEKK
ncbi:MAG TPA: peptidylprolyl isomerase [Clostridiales bacterium]|jgi:hypothetical protein|nr:peptidylprolyl isomerase [Clostridiales bacterium]HQP69407.1 peptidylprolyl isomerase [Clostridiales bacterium]